MSHKIDPKKVQLVGLLTQTICDSPQEAMLVLCAVMYEYSKASNVSMEDTSEMVKDVLTHIHEVPYEDNLPGGGAPAH